LRGNGINVGDMKGENRREFQPEWGGQNGMGREQEISIGGGPMHSLKPALERERKMHGKQDIMWVKKKEAARKVVNGG